MRLCRKLSIVRNAVVQELWFQQLSAATNLTGSKGISHYETKRCVQNNSSASDQSLISE
jgi:hypothetical protein